MFYKAKKLAIDAQNHQGTQTSKILQEEVRINQQKEIEELKQQIRVLEARLQTLTEDKDLMTLELQENNHWIDNQHALHTANKELSDKVSALSKEKIELEDKVSLLQSKFERLQAVIKAQQQARPVVNQGTFAPMGPAPCPAHPAPLRSWHEENQDGVNGMWSIAREAHRRRTNANQPQEDQ